MESSKKESSAAPKTASKSKSRTSGTNKPASKTTKRSRSAK